MTLFNRSLLHSALLSGTPIREVANRAVGKTTGAVLRALGESYNHPGRWVAVDDPDQNTEFIRREIVQRVMMTGAMLQFKHIKVQQFTHTPFNCAKAGPSPGVYVQCNFAESTQ